MTARIRWLEAFAVSGFVIALGSASAVAQKKYDVGVTDSEIKIGNVMPYSGPGSAYAAIGKTEAAYFKMINDQGGINARKINFISYDYSYNAPKTSSRCAGWRNPTRCTCCSTSSGQRAPIPQP